MSKSEASGNRGGVSGSCIYGMSTVQMVETGLLPPHEKSRHTGGITNTDRVDSNGYARLCQPQFNKSMGFSLRERQLLGLHGMLPPRVMSPAELVTMCMEYLRDYECDIDRYIYLMRLLDTSEKVLYQIVAEYPKEIVPVLYHPTVSQACRQFGLVHTKPRSLFITAYDVGYIPDILSNWPHRDIKLVIVTDGEKIQGAGDLGVLSASVPISKAVLYSALCGIPPHQILAITLDVGTDNQDLLVDSNYVGLKHPRIRDERYDRVIQSLYDSIVDRYGWSTVIQLEGIGSTNSFRLLDHYRSKYSSFNDSIQGTAAAVVGGIFAALESKGDSLLDQTVLFVGAGEAAIGIANLLTVALIELYDKTEEEAKANIWLMDSKGLIVKNRPVGGLTVNKVRWAKQYKPIHDIHSAVEELKPTILVGVSGQNGAFTNDILKMMGRNTDKPIIFCLSNPSINAEAMADEVYALLKGKCFYIGGCYYPPYELPHKIVFPSQVSSLYVTPAIAMTATACQVRTITEGMFLKAAQILASLVTETQLEQGRVYPPIEQLREVNNTIAIQLTDYVYRKNLANFYPEPKDKNYFIKSNQYNINFTSLLPAEYEWPSIEAAP